MAIFRCVLVGLTRQPLLLLLFWSWFRAVDTYMFASTVLLVQCMVVFYMFICRIRCTLLCGRPSCLFFKLLSTWPWTSYGTSKRTAHLYICICIYIYRERGKYSGYAIVHNHSAVVDLRVYFWGLQNSYPPITGALMMLFSVLLLRVTGKGSR
jgi:hypothetical protein